MTAASDLDAAAAVALEAARRAVMITRGTSLGTVSTKADAADPVTEVDTAVERMVRDLVAERLPGHTVVGEEFGGTAGDGPTWFCDPVDGTTNLAAGLPWTAFSLALAVGTTPLVGVVADPWRDQVLHAVRGRGARLDGAPVEPPESRRSQSLTGGVVLSEWDRHEPWPGMTELFAALAERYCTTRIMGSGTLTLASVAAGRATGAVVGEFHPEDHLAAALIGAEAGLAVWDDHAQQNPFPSSGGLMIAHPAVAEELWQLWQPGHAS